MTYNPEPNVDNIIQHLAFRPAPCPPSPSWFIYERGFARERNMDGQTMGLTLTNAYGPGASEGPYDDHGEPTRPHTTSADDHYASPVLPRRASDGGFVPSRTVEGLRSSTLGSLPLPAFHGVAGMVGDHEDSQEVESTSSISSDGSLLHFLDSDPAYKDISHYIDIPQFVIGQCLGASVRYLMLQRIQWTSVFHPNVPSPRLYTLFPGAPMGYYDLPNDLATIYNKDEARRPFLYRPSLEDSISDPPPQPPLPTGSLVNNIKAINHLMWLRMKRRVSVDGPDDEEVVKSILENIVLSRRVTDTHPDVVEFLMDVDAAYGPDEREDLVEMLVEQISFGAQLCFWLGDRERACALRDLADMIDAAGL
ncbi:hypothetical protein DL546_004050 [Coniochaeta pulveracea]|uniref:Uncharacterized protein n=1 Tax=Coniochaeta pulveracea TaxID=177199 RepID=A0A420Y3J8_9PEZI|nr:hypothetical protein DL546_004050 [Coniochaeta pulveracea]